MIWVFYVPFNSISVISGQWKDEQERFCAMKCHLGSGRIVPSGWFDTRDIWSLLVRVVEGVEISQNLTILKTAKMITMKKMTTTTKHWICVTVLLTTNEPEDDKINKVAYAPCENSFQPGSSLISFFLFSLWTFSEQKRTSLIKNEVKISRNYK